MSLVILTHMTFSQFAVALICKVLTGLYILCERLVLSPLKSSLREPLPSDALIIDNNVLCARMREGLQKNNTNTEHIDITAIITVITTAVAFFVSMYALFPMPSFAQNVYKWTDESGRVHFSSSQQGESQQPVRLPAIEKENFTKRIQDIKANTPETCDKHGGIDCSQGADADGSVICLDSHRDSEQPYEFSCLEALIRVSKIDFIDKNSQAYSFEELKANPKLANMRQFTQVRVSVRNMSQVEAKQVEVSVGSNEQVDSLSTGLAQIAPLSVEDYSWSITKRISFFQLSKIFSAGKIKVACENCR